MKILILCIEGNSCRSIMAEAFLQKMDESLDVFSAGIHPEKDANPFAVEVMKEIGIDIGTKMPRNFIEFEGISVDYLITICDGTKDKIDPVSISARHKIHLGFADPRKASGEKDQIIEVYRDVRDEIKNELDYFYNRILSPALFNK